jgi:predicted nucleic acid-binding protein
MAKRRKQPHSSERLILDSGALIASARGDDRVRAYIRRSVELRVPISIPVAVLAETVRGGSSDALLLMALKVGDTQPTTAQIGELAGMLLGSARRSDAVDALVVAEAIVIGGGVILTGDPDDLSVIAAGHAEIEIRPINRI